MVVDTATSARARLVRKLLAEQNTPPAGLPRDPDGSAPAAPVQLELYLHQGISGRPELYNVPNAVRLAGELDVPALRAALHAVVARHETLRTSFAEDGGRLRQHVTSSVDLPWSESDLRGLPPDRRWTTLQKTGAEEIAKPFDLSEPPLARAWLCRLGGTDHVLLITAHHLVTDGWSAGVLWHDLSACYAAAVAGRTPDLPPLPLQYADFAIWQQARSEHAAGAHNRYWRDNLSSSPDDLHLTGDLPGQAGRTSDAGPGRSRTCRLPGPLTDQLRTFAAERRCSLFTVLLGGFAAVLHRLTRADDVVIAVPVTTRQHDVVEPLIGYFVNLIPVRIPVDAEVTFDTLVDRTARALNGALAHRELPVDPPGGRPAPRVSFSMTGTAQPVGAIGDLGAEPVYFPETTAKFPLTLALVESSSGPLSGAWEYRSDLFTAETVDRWTSRLRTLLDGACAEPGRAIGSLALMDAGERELVTKWSRGPGGRPPGVATRTRPKRSSDRRD